MQSTNSKRNGQVKMLRSSKGPENELPIMEPAVIQHSQTPYGPHKCLDVAKAKSLPDILLRFVISKEHQNAFIITFI